MSLRIDTTELISGAYVIGDVGLGVLGSDVPSEGEHGASYLYNDLTLPDDADKEIRGLIVTPPSAGTFYAWEDGSFSLTGAPDGEYTFVYRLYVDGADLGTATATITIGGSTLSGSAVLDGITAGGGMSVALPTIGRPAGDVSAGSWTPNTGSDLFAMLDEETPDAGDYISTASLSTCEILLQETVFPGSSVQAVRYRASSNTGNGITVTLKQGATTIAAWSHSLTAVDTLYTRVLTPEQLALIGPGALSIQLTAT